MGCSKWKEPYCEMSGVCFASRETQRMVKTWFLHPKNGKDVVLALRVWKFPSRALTGLFLEDIDPWGPPCSERSVEIIWNSTQCSPSLNSGACGVWATQESSDLNPSLGVTAVVSLHLLNFRSYAVSLVANPGLSYKGRELWERLSRLSRADMVQTHPDTKSTDHTPQVSSETGYPCSIPTRTDCQGSEQGSQCQPLTPLGA